MTSRAARYFLFVAIVVVPAIVTAVTVPVSFKRAKTVEFCASCHVMTPYVEDLRNPDTETLAGMHYDRRWIAHHQCYTCHTDYAWFGPLSAKVKGMRHVAAYYLAPERRTIELYEPFPNANCLSCHGEARGFRENPVHEAAAAEIATNETQCLECHEPIHPETAAEDDPESADVEGEGAAAETGEAGTADAQAEAGALEAAPPAAVETAPQAQPR